MYTLVIRIELEAMVLITIISKYRYDFLHLNKYKLEMFSIFAQKINVFNSKYRHNNSMMNLNEIIFNSFSFNKAKKMITFGKRCINF